MKDCVKVISSALTALSITACVLDDAMTTTTDWERPFEVSDLVYPFESSVYVWNDLAYHYVDVAPANGQKAKGTVLAVHGNGTWSVIYRKIVAPLSESGFRVIITDQFGYGLSDKPSKDTFDYMPHSHAEVLADFIRDLDLDDLYLVLQDWGGPIGLAAGVEEPTRVSGLVIMNTWAWRLPDIPDGETAFMHAVHDRGIHAATQPAFYREGGLIKRAADGLARRNGDEGSPSYNAMREASLAPYINLDDPELPLLHPDAGDPFHISAMSTVKDGDFLEALDQSLGALREKPVYFAFGDDTAFGPYKIDTGFLGKPRKKCVDGYTPESEEVKPSVNCLDADGKAYWYPLERFLSDWEDDQVVGVWKDAETGHWVQDEKPGIVVDAVDAVYDFNQ